MTYDPACYQLAERFLQDEMVRSDYKEQCDSLAQAVQRAVEDWFKGGD